jgi:predicted RecB family nuclease
MNPLTGEVFAAFLKCRYKAYLKFQGVAGEKSDYEQAQARLAAQYRAAATRELVRRQQGAVVEAPPSLPDAIRAGPALITGVTVNDAGESCRLDALERVGMGGTPSYRPVLFLRSDKVTADDRLLLGFGASVLGRVQGTPPDVGKVVHGRGLKATRVELASLSGAVRDAVARVRAEEAPPLVLNRHCAECEFRRRCRAAALGKDDLSLLGGLSPKEVSALNARGIFTVTQFSHTFRPARMKRAAGKKHDHSLQALAIREKTVYVARRPELPAAKVMLFLDVEGLPDEGYYYLVGLAVCGEGTPQRRLSFWADGEADEASAWAAFLAAVEPIPDFVLFHYGSYESHFLDRMAARHGGDPASSPASSPGA